VNEQTNNSQDAKRSPGSQMTIRCKDTEALAILHACDELDMGVRLALEKHAAECPACAAVFLREANLHRDIASFDQPADSLDRSDLLLAECRSQLAEALDDHDARRNQPGWRPVLSPAAWWGVLRDTLVVHPAMSMAVLVIVSFLAGVAGQRTQVASTPVAPRPAMTVSAAPKITDEQLHSAQSASVGWVTPSDSRTPTVQVQLMSPTPASIEGAPEDADVERALTFVLENARQFDPGSRMDSLNVLRTRVADPEVRRALCDAARSDTNPGVRMKALESLQGFEQDPAVRRTILEALQKDANSGVRVSAINLLLNSLENGNDPGSPDAQTLAVLRDRLRNDSNNYVRLQSAAALRDFGAAK
jgi:HEAT repeats